MGEHATAEEIVMGLDHVRGAPAEAGWLELIVRRPAPSERELLDFGRLERESGLVGDVWAELPDSSTKDGGPDPKAQVTVMSARAAALIAGAAHERWALAGDQLYVDLDLSKGNLPAGSRLEIGEALIEVSADPHLGCGKFVRRFGVEALKAFNSQAGRELRLRGLNARVVVPGAIKRGDVVRPVGPSGA